VEIAESSLFRFAPDLSNPPEEVAKVASDFWHPKAVMAASAKTKATPKTTMEPVVAKEPDKKP
jgi:hypothetical protein